MHSDQLDINLDMVRQLVDEQFPQWRRLPIHPVEVAGTENALFRIGDQLTARFPLRGADAASTRRQINREAEAAQTLLGRTPVPTPEAVAFGEPGADYPLPWSVQTWLPGATANDADPSGSVRTSTGRSAASPDVDGFPGVATFSLRGCYDPW